MYTLIKLTDGSVREAVVLANTRSWMRLASPGLEDVLELRLHGVDWFDERGEPVQFGFFLATDDAVSAAPPLPQAAFRYAC